MKQGLIIIFAIILVLLSALYLSFDKIAIFALSKLYGINISYTALSKDKVNGYTFENLKILNKQPGFGFFSARSNLKLNRTTSLLKSLDIDFKFRDVHFIRPNAEKTGSMYDSLDKLVAIPFEGRWAYRDVSGTIEIFSNGLTLRSFAANGSEIRISLAGDIFYNSTINMDITIYFSKSVLKDIPDELSSVIMQDEPQGWKSFSVNTKGDYRSPSVKVSGRLFRLNVGTMVVKD